MRLQHKLRGDPVIALGFLAPSLIGFALFYMVPFVMGMVYSVQDGTREAHFVGLDNYIALFQSQSFRKAAWNTIWFTAVSVPVMLCSAVWIAIALNGKLFIRRWLRTAYVLPLVVPVASVVLVWQTFFEWNGALNHIFDYFGWHRVDWLKSDASRWIVLFLYMWKNLGYNVILILAGLQGISKDYYEVAEIEGGTRRTKLAITLIYLMPTLIFVAVMAIVQSFKVFRETYLLAGDYPHDSIYQLQHYMNNMFASIEIQKLTASAVVMVIAIWIIVTILFRAERWFRSFME
ncbi:ABC transporter permease subunit [Paenibacillus sp. HJL G12]|uniref:ABC transporter permease subunit n=1 Tax=Paenibacillus dendrobii TaxID=2691084 RepID=A0A7X3IHE4_9BACL|nr:sugar ABC transporter permease [Paenibacillus dendrobii]MWV42570.1 ABC transporter permease subunit [Paenibacillus dendrobii]